MSDTKTTSRRKTAGAFDVRTIIGTLLTLYGIVLLLAGLVGDTGEDKTGINANLWAGILLLVVGIIFLAWARLRPIVVPPSTEQDHEDFKAPPPH